MHLKIFRLENGGHFVSVSMCFIGCRWFPTTFVGLTTLFKWLTNLAAVWTLVTWQRTLPLTSFTRRHFQMDLLKWKCIISTKISLKFVPNSPINNISALAQMIAWCPPGNKSLCEPMMVCLLAHIYVTRLQWIETKSLSLRNILLMPMRAYFVEYYSQTIETKNILSIGLRDCGFKPDCYIFTV